MKRCVWCQAYRVTGDLPLRRDMLLNKVIVVAGGIVWRDDKGVLRFMCKKCSDVGMLAQMSKFRKGFELAGFDASSEIDVLDRTSVIRQKPNLTEIDDLMSSNIESRRGKRQLDTLKVDDTL